jgi:hypothetical protein
LPLGAGLDLRGRRRDGTEFPLEIGLNPIETDNGTWVLSSIVDISERKRAEAALCDERFRNMPDTVPVMIWVSGPDKSELALGDLAADSSSGKAVQTTWAVAIRASEIVRELMTYSGEEKATLERRHQNSYLPRGLTPRLGCRKLARRRLPAAGGLRYRPRYDRRGEN